ncbi:MAG: radical SAM protein [archaeon]|nr:radical SAM protein [archaeon]
MKDLFDFMEGPRVPSLIEFENREEWDGVYEIVDCKRALSPSNLPEMDYALNPYSGCEHGCIYCYAPDVTHSPWDGWRVVRVKKNIVARLSSETKDIKGIIGIGTVTDPYQGAEGRFTLTRQCLEVLKRRGYEIHLHTKSDLILRDVDILDGMKGQVAVTLTGLDERTSKITEPGAPMPSVRLETLRRLTDRGINTYALIAPISDRLEGREEEFCDAVAGTGVRRAALDPLNLKPGVRMRTERMGFYPSLKSTEKIRNLLESSGIQVRNVF